MKFRLQLPQYKLFFILLALMTGVYGVWLAIFWPGVLGEDSAAILLEIQNPESFRSGKTVFWYFFVKSLYSISSSVEIPIAASFLICAVLFARLLCWYWNQKLYKIFFFVLFAIALAPHMIYFMGTLYPDALFAVASASIMFEVWLSIKSRKASKASKAILFLALPFAVFLRPNGIVFLLPVLLAAFWIKGPQRLWWLTIAGIWCAAIFLGNHLHRATTQETQFPLAAFETVGFLQTRSMNDLWKLYPNMNDPWVLQEPKVSQASIAALTRQQPLEKIQKYRDPAYWDMLVFHPEGPQIGGLSSDDKHTVVREFWTYNLWQNLPDFIASRVNVFIASALAQGGFPSLSYASNVLPRLTTASTYRVFKLDNAEYWLKKVHAKSYKWRWILWTPWLGFGLLLWAIVRCVARFDSPITIVALPMALQGAGIFIFSIAGEYRYLLPFFTLPMVLLPAMSMRNENLSPSVQIQAE